MEPDIDRQARQIAWRALRKKVLAVTLVPTGIMLAGFFAMPFVAMEIYVSVICAGALATLSFTTSFSFLVMRVFRAEYRRVMTRLERGNAIPGENDAPRGC